MDVVGSKMNTLLSWRQGKPIGTYLPQQALGGWAPDADVVLCLSKKSPRGAGFFAHENGIDESRIANSGSASGFFAIIVVEATCVHTPRRAGPVPDLNGPIAHPEPPAGVPVAIDHLNWRRGRDSNPRGAAKPPSDFESAPL